MAVDDAPRPEWALRVGGDERPGTGVALSPRLALTSERVVRGLDSVDVCTVRGVTLRCNVADPDRELDVALLEPASRDRAFSDDAVLVPRALWRGVRLCENRADVAMWMDEPDALVTLTIQLRRIAQRGRRVRFRIYGPRKGVRRGSSGGPVVEATGETAPRLLGIVGACDTNSIDALNEAGSGWLVPIERIAERYEAVARWVETPVERSPAWKRHWEPHSRGVVQTYDRGFFFAGRREVYATLCRHVKERPGLVIVSGRRGSGKSALLARLVTLSCPRYLALLGSVAAQAVDGFPRLSRPVDAAVYARGLTAAEVVSEIADQLGVASGSAERPLDVERGAVIVVDAVDEAQDPIALMHEVVIPVVKSGAALAIAASAPAVFSEARPWDEWIDLDRGDSPGAIAGYVAKRLATRGGYSDEASQEVAGAVSHTSQGLFVVAEMITRTLSSRSPIDTDVAGWKARLPSDPAEALRGYLARFGSEQARILAVLHPLARARGAGLTIRADGVWLMAANRLRPDDVDALDEGDLRRVCEQAHDYIVSGPHDERRLYHDGMADTVRAIAQTSAQVPAVADAQFADALLSLLPEDPDAGVDAYADVDGYLLRHLPGHLADAGRTAELLRPGLLLAADQEALRRALVLGALAVPSSDEAARVAVVHALARPQPTLAQRAASLCLALRRQGQDQMAQGVARALGGPERTLPYELISAPPLPPVLAAVDGFGEITHSFDLVAVVRHGGGSLIVTAGRYSGLESWWLNGSPGPLQCRDAHSGDPSVTSGITALTVFEYDGEPLVLTGGNDRAVRSWRLDGHPGPFELPEAHSGAVTALAVVNYGDEPLIISGGDDRVLRSWRLNRRPGPLQQPYAHEREITVVAVVDHDGEPLIVSAGKDGALRSWRLDRSRGPLQQPEAHEAYDGVEALEVVDARGEPFVVSTSSYALRSWWLDGRPGPLQHSETDRGGIAALAVVDYGGEPLIISGYDRALRSWRSDGCRGPLQQPDAHRESITALAVVEHAGEPLLVSGGHRTLRSWRLHALVGPHKRSEFHRDSISALAVVDCGGAPLIVSGGHDEALRSWRLDGTPGPLQVLSAHSLFVSALAVVDYGEEPLIVSGGHRGLRSWRLDGSPGPLEYRNTEDSISELTVVDCGGEPLIISRSLDGALRSWRLDGGPGPLQRADADARYANLAVIKHGGESLIVSGGEDGAVRTWRLDGSPGPVLQHNAGSGSIQALVVVEDGGEPLIVIASSGALLSCRLDGSPGPLQQFETGEWINALAVVRHRGEPLIVSGSREPVLRTWRRDGALGPLLPADAHRGEITAVTVVEHGGEPLIVSAGREGTIIRHAVPATT